MTKLAAEQGNPGVFLHQCNNALVEVLGFLWMVEVLVKSVLLPMIDKTGARLTDIFGVEMMTSAQS